MSFAFRTSAAANLLAAAFVFLAQHANAEAPVSNAVVIIHPEKPGVVIPADFIGFSCEKRILSVPHFHAENSVLVNLYRNLGGGVLRIGGGSVENTYWSRAKTDPLSSIKDYRYSNDPITIGPLALDNLYAFAKRSGWRVIHGLNLGANDSAMAADEAAYAVQVGGPTLLAFEVGNEPNLFPKNATRVGRRPEGYGYAQYRDEIEAYYRAILDRTPHAPLAGPATTFGLKWFTSFVDDFGARIVLTTSHLYPLAAKEENPQAPRFATLENLLSAKTEQNSGQNWMPQLKASSAVGIPLRIGECNTASSGGKTGVSDVFASALWGTEFLFAVAEHGGAGVNFHGGFGAKAGYSPFSFPNGVYHASPIYYSMLLFHQAARGQAVPLECQTSANFTVHAVLGADHKLRLVLINKDMVHTVTATIRLGTPHAIAELIRLLAPSVAATEGVTLAGSAVLEDGTWTPQPGAPVPYVEGNFEVSLPIASAALLTIDRY